MTKFWFIDYYSAIKRAPILSDTNLNTCFMYLSKVLTEGLHWNNKLHKNEFKINVVQNGISDFDET